MPIAKISGDGLTAMGIAVALLWGCLGVEQMHLRRAKREYQQVLEQMQSLRSSAASYGRGRSRGYETVTGTATL